MNRTLRGRAFVSYAVLSLLLVFALYPIVVLVLNSVKTAADMALNPLGFPRQLDVGNFVEAWRRGNFARTVPNTLLLVAGSVGGIVVLAGPAAYSMSKLDLPRSAVNALIVYLLVLQSLPIQLFLVPLFSFWLRLGLVNSFLGVILIYIALGSPFSIFLMRSYFLQIPNDFRDAARVEGAGEMGIFWRIMVPLTWPAFLTVALVNSMNVWNEFLIATVFLTKTEKFTVVTSYQAFTVRFGRDWTLTSAASVMMIFPIVVTFLALQRRFVQGLTQGGLKS